MDVAATVIKQHLIDPEICIRCNTCETMCPVGAITTTHATTWWTWTSATGATTASRPAPPAASTTTARCRATGLQPGGATGLGRACRPSCRPPNSSGRRGGEAGPAEEPRQHRHRRPPTPRAAPPSTAPLRRHAAALERRPRLHQPVRPQGAEKSVTATVVGNVRVTQVGKRLRHPPRDAGLWRHALPGAGRPVHRHHPTRRRCEGPAPPCPPVQHRQPAQRRKAGLQQPVADHQARAGRPPGQAGAWRGQQLPVRPAGGRQGAGHRAFRRQLPDAQPPQEPHRDDLHRHRQRADAGDDGVAAPAACNRASSRVAS
jgi:ferredoxin